MIQIVPVQIWKEASSDKEAYLLARCAKYEKVLKAGASDRDVSQDEVKKQGWLRNLLTLVEQGMDDMDLTPLENAEAAVLGKAFQDKVRDLFPLVDGEVLREEQLGRAGHAVYVKHVTNLSTLCFIDEFSLPGYSETNGVAPVDGEISIKDVETLQKLAKTVVDIGKGLVKIVPAPYGSVLSGVFEGLSAYISMATPSQSQKDMDKLLNSMSDLMGRITWKANVQQTVKEQAGVIYAVISGLNDHYGPQKKDSKDVQERNKLVDQYLIPYLRDLDKALETLSQSDFDVASLPEYCLGAGAYFCVLQELAVLDSKHPDDPFKSTYCHELQAVKAPRFIQYVLATYDAIVAKARASVEEKTEHKYDLRLFRTVLCCPSENWEGYTWKEIEGVGRFPVAADYFGAWYYDNGNLDGHPEGFVYCACHDKWAYDTSVKARQVWISKTQSDLVALIEKELGGLKQLALNEWTRLKTHPLYGSDRVN